MLFNSYVFIFIFLPISLVGFYLIGKKRQHVLSAGWLVCISLFFYGWWNPAYLGLILLSILFNYTVGVALSVRPSKLLLYLGIAANLSILGYYKYAGFILENLSIFIGNDYHISLILPLAISFFTFQQIAYLVDAYRGETKEYEFLRYCLFVTFFPQLIAGPIVHHKEMIPQFSKNKLYDLKPSHLTIGITIFVLGLFKKVMLADSIAKHASPVFEAAEHGVVLTFFEAWGGALAYTFQLYFDFSGYSDMAIGSARMFGIVLPVNFFSPYKANSIIDFWNRWHITLSRFLRDYIYIPLGGNRKGNLRRFFNLFITMLIGGLWHGAGWTFVIWGGMHGIYLSVNHGWVFIKKNLFNNRKNGSFIIGSISNRIITFASVTIAWVMFRAETLDGAINMYSGMFGVNGLSLPISFQEKLIEFEGELNSLGIIYNGMFYNGIFGNVQSGCILLVVLLIIVWFAPNTLEILKLENPAIGLKQYISDKKRGVIWRPKLVTAILLAIITVISIMSIHKESEFLYFQF